MGNCTSKSERKTFTHGNHHNIENYSRNGPRLTENPSIFQNSPKMMKIDDLFNCTNFVLKELDVSKDIKESMVIFFLTYPLLFVTNSGYFYKFAILLTFFSSF